MITEKYNFLDSMIYTVNTVTTVGNNMETPKTYNGKILSIIYMILGSAISIYIISIFVKYLLKNKY
jgi:voltage-gated potassium channel